MKEIGVSILDVKDINGVISKLKEANSKIPNNKLNITIHYDIMDNIFVPNSGVDIEKMKDINNIYITTHLMVQSPKEYIDKAIKYGSKKIIVHYEIEKINEVINYLEDKKKEYKDLKIGIAIKPNTSVEEIEKYLDKIDEVLVMSVEPGFGGQKYINSANEKTKILKEKYKKIVSVDGGVNDITVIDAIRSGVDIVDIGSYLTKADNLYDRIAILNIINEIEMCPKELDLEYESRTLGINNENLLAIRRKYLHKIEKVWYNIVSQDILKYFLSSDYHEYRSLAVYILNRKIKKDYENTIKFVNENIKYLNSWDLVDSFFPNYGKTMLKLDNDKVYKELRKYTISDDVYIKRAGIVSLLYFAKNNKKDIVFKVIDDVFYYDNHLIQKANGWMLRELYVQDKESVIKYLSEKNKYKKIPSILKSYACEKMSKEEKERLK